MAYTTIDDGSAHFNTVLYTGDNTANRAITGVGFQPDWGWLKQRNGTGFHELYDSVRGVTKALHSNSTDAEVTTAALDSFDSDGITVSYDSNNSGSNGNGKTAVWWLWRGSDSNAVSNTDGSITSTVSANTTAGFSIITYTGNGTAGATIGHGLGKVPKMIIQKSRERTDYNWQVYHEGVSSDPETDFLRLNTNAAVADNDTVWNDTAPTSSVITLGNNIGGNANGEGIVVYAFAEIKGYSKFGSYTGNGNTDGTFVYTGFRPAFIMARSHDNAEGWNMIDNKREGFNVSNDWLSANSNAAENDGATYTLIDILSNGFKWRNADINGNGSGRNCFYMAFAEHPFVSSEGAPVTAR
jgi:hypothetical protein